MTPNRYKIFIIIIILLSFSLYGCYNYFENQKYISTLPYGILSNKIRQKLHIPIIDTDMIFKGFFPDKRRWINASNNLNVEPIDDKVIHIWKNVCLHEDDSLKLYEEHDGFSKKINNRIVRLNIYSEIYGDTLSTRRGIVFFRDESLKSRKLDDSQIDSIVKIWGLDYLVR